MLIRLDHAFQSFFRRCRSGQAPGFPRFRPLQRMECIDVVQVSGGMVRRRKKGYVLCIKGIPHMRLHSARGLPEGGEDCARAAGSAGVTMLCRGEAGPGALGGDGGHRCGCAVPDHAIRRDGVAHGPAGLAGHPEAAAGGQPLPEGVADASQASAAAGGAAGAGQGVESQCMSPGQQADRAAGRRDRCGGSLDSEHDRLGARARARARAERRCEGALEPQDISTDVGDLAGPAPVQGRVGPCCSSLGTTQAVGELHRSADIRETEVPAGMAVRKPHVIQAQQ